MYIYSQTGKLALGSRLRRLSEHMTDNAAQVYKMYGIDLKPKWFPVFYVLSHGGQKTITAIAEEIGHSHPFVSKVIREMSVKGYIVEKADKQDGRKNMVSLSKKMSGIIDKIENTYVDVDNAIDEILADTKHNLWQALEEWEILLKERPYLDRVAAHRKKRESKDVRIVDYSPKYRTAFKELNEEWITQYFKMEPADHKALDNPGKSIIAKGGYIVVAILNEKPVGVCALVKMSDGNYDFELAKMAVSPQAQGKNIGWLLAHAVIQKAKSLGAKRLYLESNTVLQPAINLYYKLGFKKIAGHRDTPYERSNIQMELVL